MVKISGSETIEIIGKDIYGDKFSIKDPKRNSIYKTVYNQLILGISDSNAKGIFVTGGVGVGKSAMMQVFQMLFKDTERRFKRVSGYELKDLSEELSVAQIKALYGSGLKCDLYIDDIGFSVDSKRFGNTINIISEIIIDRYELFVNSGYKTHLSSNILAFLKNNETNTPTIETMYGVRVLDRIKEMCDLIIWKGDSLRK